MTTLSEQLAAERENGHWLGELLAVIHCDGGHYQSEHGTEKATADAIKKRNEMVIRIDELETQLAVERGRREHAERDACGFQDVNTELLRQLAAEQSKLAIEHEARLAVVDELATKDELHAAALQVLERHHQKQLAAEREKLRLANIDALQNEAECNELREAREDESKLIRKLSDDVMHLSEQLAAHAEQLNTLRELREHDRKQLAAERELREQYFDTLERQHKQVQVLVDALKEVQPSLEMEHWHIIDAALAKIEKT